jgi:hypothetical protein
MPEPALRNEVSEGSPRGARVPAMVEIEMTPETPPEESLEWRITRQQALLKTLRRHLEANETKGRNATREEDRQLYETQIQVLRNELAFQEAELNRLREEQNR